MLVLLLSMLRARRVQAVTIFLLSMVATAAAVAGTVALRTVDLAVVRTEVAQASIAERSIAVSAPIDPSAQASGAFDTVATAVAFPGFDVIRAGEMEIFPPPDSQLATPTGTETTRLAFRDRVCDHLVIVKGRCFASTLEVVLGDDAARRAGLEPGDRTLLQSARYNQSTGLLIPDGQVPTMVTVVGTFHPRDSTAAYWGATPYFPINGDGTQDAPVFGSAQTFDLVDHTIGTSTADAVAGAEVFAVERLADLRATLDRLLDPEEERSPDVTISSSLPDLLTRIDRAHDLASQLVPVAFVPLVVMCLFVVFLAVSYGLVARRHEVGLVTLRGTTPARRWWLALAEPAVMILLGAPVGYLLGHLVVGAVGRIFIGGAQGSEVTLAAAPYALIALGGALAVAFLGQRRAIAEPVVDLLRGVPKRSAAWRTLAFDGVIAVLAVLGVIQLRAVSGLAGVVLLVPGLVVLAVALLASRLFAPVASGIARFALRTGRLGSGLAAIQIARRPGSQRLFALLAVALGLLTFVAAGTGVAAEGRDDRAGILVGAPTVLSVDRATASRLLAGTRQADPDGTWAMAVTPVEVSLGGAPKMLAVDSSRLAAAAAWRPEFGASAADVSAAIRPPAGRPMLLTADAFTVDIDRIAVEDVFDDGDVGSAPDPLDVAVEFESVRDGTRISPVLQVALGRREYEGQAPGCAAGCRLVGLSVGKRFGRPFSIALHGMRGGRPAIDIIAPDDLNRRGRWAGSTGAVVSPFGGALTIQNDRGAFGAPEGVTVSVVDVPLPVPAASTKAEGAGAIRGNGRDFVDVTVALAVPMLPRLGGVGTVVDLDYVIRTGILTGPASGAEIWLGPDAPADAMRKLRDAGLAVRVQASISQARTNLDNSGPAMALRFHLVAAALGVLLALGGLGLVAAVDRRRRADDLRALRVQGLPRRFVRRAALWGYLWLVIGAAGAGLAAGAVAWLATGPKLPVFTDTLAQLPTPRWPAPAVVLVPWSLASAVLIAAAIAAAWILRSAVRPRP